MRNLCGTVFIGVNCDVTCASFRIMNFTEASLSRYDVRFYKYIMVQYVLPCFIIMVYLVG